MKRIFTVLFLCITALLPQAMHASSSESASSSSGSSSKSSTISSLLEQYRKEFFARTTDYSTMLYTRQGKSVEESMDLEADEYAHRMLVNHAITDAEYAGVTDRLQSIRSYFESDERDPHVIDRLTNIINLINEDNRLIHEAYNTDNKASLKHLAQRANEATNNRKPRLKAALKRARELSIRDTWRKEKQRIPISRPFTITLRCKEGTIEVPGDALAHAAYFDAFLRFRARSKQKQTEVNFGSEYSLNQLKLIAEILNLRKTHATVESLSKELQKKSLKELYSIIPAAHSLIFDEVAVSALQNGYAHAVQRAFVPTSTKHFRSKYVWLSKLPDPIVQMVTSGALIRQRQKDIAPVVDSLLHQLPLSPLQTIENVNNANSLTTSQRYIASFVESENSIQLSERENPSIRFTLNSNLDEARISSLTFSPDERYLACTLTQNIEPNEGEPAAVPVFFIQIWDLGTKTLLTSINPNHQGYMCASTFSPDSNLLFTYGGAATIKLWSPQTGELLRSFENDAEISKLIVSTNGKYLAADIYYGPIKIWNLSKPHQEAQVIQTNDEIMRHTIAFTQDSQNILSYGEDMKFKVYNLSTNQETQTELNVDQFQAELYVSSARLSSNGNYLAVCSYEHPVQIFNPLLDRNPLCSLGEPGSDAVFLQNSTLLETRGQDSHQIWSIPDCLELSYNQFKLMQRASTAWKHKKPFVISREADRRIYHELPSFYKKPELFHLTDDTSTSSSSGAASSSGYTE